jgi:hypothetical protein
MDSREIQALTALIQADLKNIGIDGRVLMLTPKESASSFLGKDYVIEWIRVYLPDVAASLFTEVATLAIDAIVARFQERSRVEAGRARVTIYGPDKKPRKEVILEKGVLVANHDPL